MTDTKLETLIEDYQRRIRSATTIIEDPATSQSQRERVLVKLGEYKAFLRDLESLEASVPTPKGNGMTDTVNKQALDLAKRWLKDIEGTKSPTALLASVALSEIQALEDQAPLGTTPVQGYREALIEQLKAREQEVAARIKALNPDVHIMNIGLEQVRLSEVQRAIKTVEALSQTDIQPSRWIPVSEPPIEREWYLVTDGGAVSYGQWYGDGWYVEDSPFLGDVTHWMQLPVPPGINSTEDDQPGPSISSTQLMLEGEEQ